MLGVKLLLDTNAVIAWMREDDDIRRAFGNCHPAMTLFSIGEMIYGIRKSARPAENEQILQRALSEFDLLFPDLESASHYGDIFWSLRAKGKPIPINDVWIAALALQHHLPLLSRDAHFSEIERLSVLRW